MSTRLREEVGVKDFLTASLIFLFLIFAHVRFVSFYNNLSSAGFQIAPSRRNYIEGSFASIQEAINKAENGSTIHIPSGTYLEHIVINKTISLVGENASTTIIDGENDGTVVKITADNVSITGFTIQNSGWGWTKNGIYVHHADNCKIKNNLLFQNCQNIRLNYSRRSTVKGNTINGDGYGIRLIHSVDCEAMNNNVSNCIGAVHLQYAINCTVKTNYFAQNSQGIRMYSPCTHNRIVANIVYNNTYDGMIEAMPNNTTFFGNYVFHNNFINNTHRFIYKVSGNIWDDGYPSGGNYWSKYNGTDLRSGPYQNETGSDGIGDTPYAINIFDVDKYPLVHPYGFVRNLNTSLTYLTIQSAIDDSKTLNRHVLTVGPGVYHEHVNIYKPLTLIGQNRLTTIIDGRNAGTVLFITADNVTIVEFTIRNSGADSPPYGMDCGLLLNHSMGSNITHNRVLHNQIGIYLFFSKANVIEYNIVSSNRKNGIWLWYSSNNFLRGNEISNNSYNFGVFGGSFADFNNTITKSNVVDGKPIRYLIEVKNEIIDNQTSIGALYLINCINVTVRNLTLTKNGHGVFCYNVTESNIEKVTVSGNNYGIYLQNSNGNIINGNRCSENWVGICLQDSNSNFVESNIAANGEKGISLYKANSNNLKGNEILNNLYGIRFFSSNLNEIFHNNLIENTEQVNLISSYQNVWNGGFEGNFWSNYVGSDTDRDGVGDTAQVIDNNNCDHYPLLGIFRRFTVFYKEESYGIAVISNSTILNVVFEARNKTIQLKVNNTGEAYGFCRICVPHVLVEPEITVVIDNGLTETLHPNYTLHSDNSHRWIYFAYQHPTHEILIIPEFRSTIFLSSLMAATLCCFALKQLKAK